MTDAMKKQIAEYRRALRDAFAQNQGWTKRQLIEWLAGTNDPREEAFADAQAFLDDELPEHYYSGKPGNHNSQSAVWYSSRALEIERRVGNAGGMRRG